MENFIDIPGFDNYQVSDMGRVRNKTTGKIKKNSLNKRNGYLFSGLMNNGKFYNKRVHQLVAMAFLNHTPCGNKIVVHHIDEDKTNNNLSNLKLCTQIENHEASHWRKCKWRGVSKRGNKWQAEKSVNKVKNYIGSYNCPTSAYFAYLKY